MPSGTGKEHVVHSPRLPFGNEQEPKPHTHSPEVASPSKVTQVKDNLKQVIDDFEQEARQPRGNWFQRFGLIFSSVINCFPKPLRYIMSFLLGAAPLALMLIPGVNLLVAAIVGSILSAFAWCSLASVTEIQSLYQTIILNEVAQLRVLYETIVRLESLVIKLEGISNNFQRQLDELSEKNKLLDEQILSLKLNNTHLSEQLSNLELQNKTLQQEIKELEKTRLGLEHSRKRLEQEIEQLMTNINALKGERKEFTQLRDRLEKQLHALQATKDELTTQTKALNGQLKEAAENNQFLSHQVKVLQLMTQQFVEQFPDKAMQQKFMEKITGIINDKAEMSSILGNLEQLEKALSEINDENHELAEQLSEVIASLQNLKQHEARNQLLRQAVVDESLSDSQKLDKVKVLLVQRQFKDSRVAEEKIQNQDAPAEHNVVLLQMWQKVQEQRKMSHSGLGLACFPKDKSMSDKKLTATRKHTLKDVCQGTVCEVEYMQQFKIS